MVIGINALYLVPHVVGGTETYAVNLLIHLAGIISSNDTLIIYCSRNSAILFNDLSNCKVKVYPFDSTNRPLRVLIEQTLLPIDCYNYHVDTLFSLGYSQPFFLPCKSLTTIHDLNWYYCPEDFTWTSRQIITFFNAISIHRATAIISVSKSTKAALSKLFPASCSKTQVIYHGAPLLTVKKSSSPYPRPYLFSLLSHYPHKNLSTLIKVFQELLIRFPDLHLVIGGTGNPSAQDERRESLHFLLKDKIHFLKHVSDEELARVYAHAAVFVFPSLYEGFGLPVLEAMHYGAPVVSSNVASLPEVIGKGGVLVDPLNVSAYVREISKILNNSGLSNKLKLAGKHQANTFSWEKCATQTFNLIKETYDKK